MPQSNFIDHVRIHAASGAGGNGCVSFRREKHVPLGGPDGGDGGRGGSIVLKANAQLWTLLDLRYRKFIKAQSGQDGQGGRRRGKDANDEVLEVPLGTLAKDAETGEVLGEVTEDGEAVVLLSGGKGGEGNWHYRSATNQAPEYARSGQAGQERQIVLELKILADVGLVGFPNAGKSTLLSTLTAAKPKIGDYPFTTLVPNLGIVRARDSASFVMADIPGIIEGASEGRGLGDTFLRHIERNAVLLFVVAVDSDDIARQYEILSQETEAYEPMLSKKPRLLAISKTDVVDAEYLELIQPTLPADVEAVFISSVAEQGLTTLKNKLWAMLRAERRKDAAADIRPPVHPGSSVDVDLESEEA